jgi:hypothetical protein
MAAAISFDSLAARAACALGAVQSGVATAGVVASSELPAVLSTRAAAGAPTARAVVAASARTADPDARTVRIRVFTGTIYIDLSTRCSTIKH